LVSTKHHDATTHNLMCLVDYYNLIAQVVILVNNWHHEAWYCPYKCSRNKFTAGHF